MKPTEEMVEAALSHFYSIGTEHSSLEERMSAALEAAEAVRPKPTTIEGLYPDRTYVIDRATVDDDGNVQIHSVREVAPEPPEGK